MTIRRKSLPLLATPTQCNVRFFRSCPHRHEFSISSTAADSYDFPKTMPSSSLAKPIRSYSSTTSQYSTASTLLPSIDDYEIISSNIDTSIAQTHKIIYESYPKTNSNSSQSSQLPQQRATETILNPNLTPLGSFTTSTMEQAEDLLYFWTQHPPIVVSPPSSINGHHHIHPSIQGAMKATQILYRIIDEMAFENPHAHVNIEMIDTLLHHWNLCITTTNTNTTNGLQQQHRQRENQQRQLSVKVMEQLLHKLEKVLDYDSMPYKTFVRAFSKIPHPSAAQAAEGLLDGMIQAMGTARTRPDLGSFNMVLASWSNVSVEHGDWIVVGDGKNSGIGDWNQDGATVDAALGIGAGDRAMGVLKKMKDLYHKGNDDVQPNLISFSLAIRALLKADITNEPSDGISKRGKHREIAVYQANEILQDMIAMYKSSCDDGNGGGMGDVNLRPDKFMFDAVINALGKLYIFDGDVVPAEKALALLHQMKELSIMPDTVTYNLVIGAFLRRSSRINRRSSNNRTHHPNHNKQQRNNIAIIDIIKELITAMEEEKDGNNNVNNDTHSTKPDFVTYNSLIKAYANAGNSSMAESTLRWMIEQCDDDDYADEVEIEAGSTTWHERLWPTTTTWNSVIEAHAKSSGKDSVERAMRILHKMQSYSERRKELKKTNRNGNSRGDVDDPYSYDKYDCQPDKVSMSLIISALTKSAKQGNTQATKQALQILDRIDSISNQDSNNLMKPDAIIYTSVMDCIAKSNDPKKGEKAMDLLRRMETLHGSGKRDDLKPDTVSYNTVLSALASSGGQRNKCRAKEAEDLLNSMEASGDESIAPNTVSYSTVISAWAKSGEKGAANAAIRLLRRMERLSAENVCGQRVRPNTISYTSTLDALSRSGQKGASEKAMEILRQMEDRFADGEDHVRPNAYSYSSVIMAIANGREKDKISIQAQEVLRRMIQISRDSNPDASPNTVVFNTVIKAIEKSSVLNKALEAQGILDVMNHLCNNSDGHDVNAHPNARTYNGVLRCCAFTHGTTQEENRAAFDIAMNTLEELRDSKHCLADMYTYPAIFKACERLLVGTERKNRCVDMRKEDFQKIRRVFDMCCEDGMLDSLVLNSISKFLSINAIRNLLKTRGEKTAEEEVAELSSSSFTVELNSLPQSWRRNIMLPYAGRKRNPRKK